MALSTRQLTEIFAKQPGIPDPININQANTNSTLGMIQNRIGQIGAQPSQNFQIPGVNPNLIQPQDYSSQMNRVMAQPIGMSPEAMQAAQANIQSAAQSNLAIGDKLAMARAAQSGVGGGALMNQRMLAESAANQGLIRGMNDLTVQNSQQQSADRGAQNSALNQIMGMRSDDINAANQNAISIGGMNVGNQLKGMELAQNAEQSKASSLSDLMKLYSATSDNDVKNQIEAYIANLQRNNIIGPDLMKILFQQGVL